MSIILGALLTLLFVLLVFTFWFVVRMNKRTEEELSFSSKCYEGPAGEPLWNGILPTSVDDYTETSLCLRKLKKKVTIIFRKTGRIIGYRISPTLVIHSRIHPSLNLPDLSFYIERYGGKLLNLDECWLLLDNWDKVSQLREKAGDTPLNVKTFWALSAQLLIAEVDVRGRSCQDIAGFNNVWCALILKR